MAINKKSRASLTIEAIIAFTCYLTFMFFLLNMVKMSMITIVVNGAANEAAKQIATAAYPLAMFNGAIEDGAEEAESLLGVDASESPLDAFSVNNPMDMVNAVMNGGTEAAVKHLSADIGSLAEYFTGVGMKDAFDIFYRGANELISRQTIKLVGSMMNSYIDDSGMPIDKSGIKVRIAKLPLPSQLYESGINYGSGAYSDFKISKDDIEKDDVVIGIEYDYEINLPFLNKVSLKFRDAAVEKAWMTGCSSTPAANEGIDLDALSELITSPKKFFYVGSKGHSKCYHKKSCMTLYRGASPKLVTNVDGLEPCKVCNPGKAN